MIYKVNWISFTTDFESALINSFKNTFNFIKNLKHNGCFFHFMQNIRKYLLKNKYTIKENIFRYNYIIEKISLLPFKKNIEKTIYNDINKICNEDRFYKD